MKSMAKLLTGGLMGLILCAPGYARVTRIVIDETAPFSAAAGSTTAGMAYERGAGRAFGELDPKVPGNAIIQDIELARDADGKVRYVASFVIYKPVDMGQASGMMWHDVPNRGRAFPMAPQEMAFGDVMLSSAWQGDNAGSTVVRPTAAVEGLQFLQLPVARGPGNAAVTGEVFARIVNRSGLGSQPLMVQTNPVPYKPVSLDTAQARLVSRAGENQRGEVLDEVAIAPADWAWARCDATHPFPGTPDATQICLRNGFDANRLYQVVFTAADPYVLGIGFAAWRDLGLALAADGQDQAAVNALWQAASLPGQDFAQLGSEVSVGLLGIRILAGGALSGEAERHPVAVPTVAPIASASPRATSSCHRTNSRSSQRILSRCRRTSASVSSTEIRWK